MSDLYFLLVDLLYPQVFYLLILVDVDEIIVNYPSIFELMNDLQDMGENSCLNLTSGLSRDTILAASAIYSCIFRYNY